MEGTVEDCRGMGTKGLMKDFRSLTFPLPIASIPPVGGNAAVAQVRPPGREGIQGVQDSGQGTALPF